MLAGINEKNAYFGGFIGKEGSIFFNKTFRMSYWYIVEQFRALRSGLGGILKNHIFSCGPPTNQHQILEQLAALSFNASSAGQGMHRGGHGGGRGTPPPPYVQPPPTHTTTYQQGYGGRRRRQGRGGGGRTQQQYFLGTVHPGTPAMGGVFPPTYAPPAGGAGTMLGYAPPGGMPRYAPLGGRQPQEQPPYSNLVKRYTNWNACYTCGFDVPDGHTSMSCQAQRKAGHDVYFT